MPTMKAIQVSQPRSAFELVERPLPKPQENQVRIKVQACGVCHSDSFVKEGGAYPIAYPRIPGHEVIGIIDQVGEKCTRLAGWATGRRWLAWRTLLHVRPLSPW